MLQLKNETPFRASVAAIADRDGVDALCTVVKGTFRIAPGCPPAEEQVPVALAGAYHGEPGKSSLRVASDVGLPKPGADVLLVGHARAPRGRPATRVDVTLRAGTIRRSVAVIGDRTWESSTLGSRLSAPVPFETMPLVWERAFGGPQHPANPVGTGMRGRGRDLDGLPAPNLEDPAALIRSARDEPAPVGFAPIGPDWEPRRRFAGTYDAAWERSRAPYLPADFDPRFFHVAPPGLVSPQPLAGGEPVEIAGVHPTDVIHFAVPRLAVETEYVLDGARHAPPARLDTLVVEPDAGRVVLVWRSLFRCNRRTLRVREIRVRAAAA